MSGLELIEDVLRYLRFRRLLISTLRQSRSTGGAHVAEYGGLGHSEVRVVTNKDTIEIHGSSIAWCVKVARDLDH